MTTEQMDWLDDHDPGRFRRDPKRKPLLEAWFESGTCDWGNCNRVTIDWRWHSEKHRPRYGQWLAVCARHSEGYRPWWRRFWRVAG